MASFTCLRCSTSFVFERKHEEMAMYWEYAVLRSFAATSTLSAFLLVFFSLNSPMRSERKVWYVPKMTFVDACCSYNWEAVPVRSQEGSLGKPTDFGWVASDILMWKSEPA